MDHVAVDLGASGGTVYLGHVTPTRFDVEEVYRFDNRPVERDGRYVWDLEMLLSEIENGLRAADERSDGVDYVGVDTWGLDFALLSDGEVLRDPVSYRDPAATATREQLFETVDRQRVFKATGVTNWNTPNTLWQLHTLVDQDPALVERADTLLMMPQVLSALFGGKPTGEVTVASTTQMVDPGERTWATDLLEDLELPTNLLPTLQEPGSELGSISSEFGDELSTTPDLITPASHDTAAAVAGLPLDDGSAFLSTGSWFIVGVERDEPVRSTAAFEAAVSNELGVDGSVRLLKNVSGFFLLEECREVWRRDGQAVDYDTLVEAARHAPSHGSLVDPDASQFDIESDVPAQIRKYCRETDQDVPSGTGEIVRCLLESLASKTALHLQDLTSVTGTTLERVHVGGGGVRNELFCRLLAGATGKPVHAGPVEATAVGNLLTQAVAAGTLPDVATGRQLVTETFGVKLYEPANSDAWEEPKRRLADLVDDEP